MPNQIERNVFVLSDRLKDPIRYVQNTNALPIVFHFIDFDIPSGAVANVYVNKPSQKAVYTSAQVSGNDVTIDVTTQMVAEVGYSEIQVQLTNSDNILVTFAYPMLVSENFTDPDAEESKNEASFFDELGKAAEAANEAAEAANEAAQNVPNLVNSYLEEHPISADSTPTLENHILIFPAGTYPAS